MEELSRLHQEKDDQEFKMTLQISEFEQEIIKLKENEQEIIRLNELSETKLNTANEQLASVSKRNKELCEEKANLESKVIELFGELQTNQLDAYKQLASNLFANENNECEDCKCKLLNAIDKMQYSESKAFSYEIECRSLQKRLELISNENQELKLSIKNYNEHINEMTEHIASLNDKIVCQCEEIDKLKDCKSIKNQKKNGINKYLKI